MRAVAAPGPGLPVADEASHRPASLGMSHSFTVRSRPPDASCFSQSFTVWSWLPEASNFPSSLKATQATPKVCPVSVDLAQLPAGDGVPDADPLVLAGLRDEPKVRWSKQKRPLDRLI